MIPLPRHSLEVESDNLYTDVCGHATPPGGGYDAIGLTPGEEILEGGAIMLCCVWAT